MFLMPHSTAEVAFGLAEGTPRSTGTDQVATMRLTSVRAATELSTGAVAPTTRIPLMIQYDWYDTCCASRYARRER